MRALVIVLLLQGLAPRGADRAPQPLGPAEPGKGGDAVLPAGYMDVLWGYGAAATQAVRGRALEELRSERQDELWLIETPPPGEQGAISAVKYHFWRDQLVEVVVHYAGTFQVSEGREFVSKFEARYGDAALEKVYDPDLLKLGRNRVIEERYGWRDPFTTQILRRELGDENWTLLRRSLVVDQRRMVTEAEERDRIRLDKIRDIKLD